MVEFMETMLVLVQLVLEGVLLEEALAVREEDVGQRVVGLPVVHYTARHINIPIVGLGFVFVISYVHQQIYKKKSAFGLFSFLLSLHTSPQDLTRHNSLKEEQVNKIK